MLITLQEVLKDFIKSNYLKLSENNIIHITYDTMSDIIPYSILEKRKQLYINEYCEYDLLKLPVVGMYIRYLDDNKRVKVTKTYSETRNEIIYTPSKKSLIDYSLYNAEKYAGTRYYPIGSHCIWKGKIYESIRYNDNSNYREFDPNCWKEISAKRWVLEFEVMNLPKKYTDSFLYKEDFLNPHIFRCIKTYGNSVMGFNNYHEAIDYMMSENIKESLDDIISDIVEFKVRIRHCDDSSGGWFIIEKPNKRLGKNIA